MTHRQYVTRIGTIQALVAVVSIGYCLSLLGKVPNPMATKFSLSGEPTQFSSPGSTLILMGAIIIGMVILFLSLKGMREGAVAKLNAGVSTATVAFLGALSAAMFHVNAYPEASFGTLALYSLGASAVIGIIAAVIAQPVATDAGTPTVESAISVPAGGTASWTSNATLSTGASIAMWLIAIIMFIGGAATTLLTGETTGGAIIIGCALIVALATWAFSSFTVNINRNGISYYSPIKVPNTSLKYSDVEKVEVAHISPGNWGGWGLRQRPNGIGLITRSGEGLRITHSGGRVTEITCDNPQVGAGLANHFMK